MALFTWGCDGQSQCDEVHIALERFERGISSGSRFERVDAVYALDKYVRKHTIVVDRLVNLLRDHKDSFMRGTAARVLALTADGGDLALKKNAAKALIAALDDKEQYPGENSAWAYPASVRHEAASGLKAFGELAKPAVGKLGQIVADVGAADLGARIAAAEALGKLGPDAAPAVPELIKVLAEPLQHSILEDESLTFRLTVIETLGAVGEAAGDGVPELTKLLKTGRPERIYAAYALCKMGAAAKPAISELLEQADVKDNDFSHFTTAMAELGKLMRPYIVADLESVEERRLFRALHTLMAMREKAAFAVPQLRKTIDSPVRLVRQNSIDVIMRMGPAGEAALNELEVCLTDDDAWVRYTAAHTIVQLKPDHAAARMLLIEMLDDNNMSQHAMTGLWHVGERAVDAIPKLEGFATKSNDPFQRTRAAVTLWIVHPESKIAPAVMREMLQHENIEVRGSAAGLVGRVGADARPILDLLREMQHDENSSIRTWARGSVAQIEAALKQ